MIKVTGLSKAHTTENASSLFDVKIIVETISVQRMRKIAKNEPIYVMVIRTNEDADIAEIEDSEPTNDDQIVTMNEDTTRTEYPVQVQELLNEFSDIFSKELPAGLPPQRQLDHRIELVPGAEPPHRHHTVCIMISSSTCTNEPFGEDLCARSVVVKSMGSGP